LVAENNCDFYSKKFNLAHCDKIKEAKEVINTWFGNVAYITM
jgi:hypothetical protein